MEGGFSTLRSGVVVVVVVSRGRVWVKMWVEVVKARRNDGTRAMEGGKAREEFQSPRGVGERRRRRKRGEGKRVRGREEGAG